MADELSENVFSPNPTPPPAPGQTEPQHPAQNRLKRKVLEFWHRHLKPILIIVLLFTTFRSAIADWNDVPTPSMRPTIVEGDRIFVNKLAYGLKVPFTTVHVARWGTPQRGDIVVFYAPDTGIRLVKRVVGIPGDRIAIRNNQLFINGQAVKYSAFGQATEGSDYRSSQEFLGGQPHAIQISPGFSSVANMLETDPLPAGEYFMMGDNRDNSRDSRFFGTVRESEIVGRATRVVFSLNKHDHWLPRGDRFFKALP